MEKKNREFIIQNLMVEGFIENYNQEMVLEEMEETGRSELKVRLLADNNLCITNVDKKKTDIQFFQRDKVLSMYKRVDHIIFEHKDDDCWKLYLIEMKSSIGQGKWTEIKGKFRASYLLAKAVAGMLELKIAETVMCTTFEKVQFAPPDTMPVARRAGVGKQMIKMEQEWSGQCLRLNLGELVSFVHIPIQMTRNRKGILVGTLVEACSA